MAHGVREFVTLNNSHLDSAGVAGIEIDVFTPDYGNTLTVDSLVGAGRPARIYVPDAGEVSVFVRLYQNDTRVAEGHMSWTLQSGVNYWRVVVQRAPYGCDVPLCHRIQRIEINEGARNYPDEALWILVERYVTGGAQGVMSARRRRGRPSGLVPQGISFSSVGTDRFTVNWTPPASEGTSAITGYEIRFATTASGNIGTATWGRVGRADDKLKP